MSTQLSLRKLDHRAAWYADRCGGKQGFAFELDKRHRDALQRAVEKTHKQGLRLEQITPKNFDLATIDDDLRNWVAEMRAGKGLVILQGFPVDELSDADVERAYFGLGSYFGRAVSQSKMGDLIGRVEDIGGKDNRERAYRNSRELKLHTDRCDHIGMLCLRPAFQGGVSGYASALAIHNEILASRPDLLAVLYEGFPLHRFGEQLEGEEPVTPIPIPIFSMEQGVPCVIYIRGYIDLAVQEGHIALSDLQLEALDYLDEISNRDDIRLNFTMQTGELSLFNNCLVLHTRTAFEDHPSEPSLRRRLLRLWLREDDRPAAPGVRLHKGDAGIAPRADASTYYQAPGSA